MHSAPGLFFLKFWSLSYTLHLTGTVTSFSWCSWLSHLSNTQKVSSSNLDENMFLFLYPCPPLAYAVLRHQWEGCARRTIQLFSFATLTNHPTKVWLLLKWLPYGWVSISLPQVATSIQAIAPLHTSDGAPYWISS